MPPTLAAFEAARIRSGKTTTLKMRNITLTAVALLAAPAFAADAAFALNGDAARGEASFKTHCASCHGAKGTGTGPAGFALNPRPTNFTDPALAERLTGEWVYKVIKNGGAANGRSPLMVAWSGMLNDQQIRDVAAFVLTFVPARPAAASTDSKKPARK